MNILLINNINPLAASGSVGLDLYNGFKSNGHFVKLLVNVYKTNYPEGVVCVETRFEAKKKEILTKISNRLKLGKNQNLDSKYHIHEVKEQNEIYRTDRILKTAGFKPDAIIMLFIKDFINTKNMYELYEKTDAPIYWLMYDMAPITGGCHYAWDCKGYLKDCGTCPGLYSSDPHDPTYINLKIKKNYIDKTNIQLITASEWQYRQSKSSSLFRNKTIHKILLSVDSKVFKPVNKENLRTEMGIPNTKKIIFLGAVYMSDLRKGMQYLLESLKLFNDKIMGTTLENNILLLIAGVNIEEIAGSLPFEYHYLGYVDNTKGIASAYQAADVFVCPSIEDSGPSMINQSIMCGTPVVSFEMGVSPDIVISGKTGYMAKLKDSDDLAQGLFNVLSMSDDQYDKMAKNCRELAVERFSQEVQILQFENILNASKD